MKRLLRIRNPLSCVFVLLLLILLFGCVSAKQKKLEAGFQPLTGSELNSIISGKKGVYVSSKKGMVSNVEWKANGEQMMSNSKLSDKGSWRIVGDELGSIWTTLRGGKEEFTQWFEVGENKYQVYNRAGTLRGVITVE